MSAPVDLVLCLCTAEVLAIDAGNNEFRKTLRDARSALGDLIEVAKLAATINILHEPSWGPGPCRCSQCQLITKAKSTLARLKGGAA